MRWGRKRRLQPKTHCQCRLCAGAQSPSQTLWANKDWFEQAQAQNFAGIEVSRTNTLKAVITGLKSVFSVPVSHFTLLHQQASWIGLKSVVMVVRTRQLWNKTTHQVQFYLTSLESDAPWRVLFACIGALKINCTGR